MLPSALHFSPVQQKQKQGMKLFLCSSLKGQRFKASLVDPLTSQTMSQSVKKGRGRTF